jgi:hypothetical protein
MPKKKKDDMILRMDISRLALPIVIQRLPSFVLSPFSFFAYTCTLGETKRKGEGQNMSSLDRVLTHNATSV